MSASAAAPFSPVSSSFLLLVFASRLILFHNFILSAPYSRPMKQEQVTRAGAGKSRRRQAKLFESIAERDTIPHKLQLELYSLSKEKRMLRRSGIFLLAIAAASVAGVALAQTPART